MKRTRKQRAAIYRGAAAAALENMACEYLRTHGMPSYDVFDWLVSNSYEERCLALCFIAAIAEAGDDLRLGEATPQEDK